MMNIVWHDLQPSDFEGQVWSSKEFPFGRMPDEFKKDFPNLYQNGASSTGMCVFFDTDTSAIHVKYELGFEDLGEQNYNVTAHDGVDLYAWDECEGRWRWGGATPHFVIKDKFPCYAVVKDMQPKKRHWRMYMPLRNAVMKIAIGVDEGASFRLVPPRKSKLVVYYGTSIVHGAYSIRSGLGITQILGRKLNRPMVNLGFSGAAKMELTMAQYLAKINASMYILDPYHNMSHADVLNNEKNFLETLCSAKKKTPVLILSAPPHLLNWLKSDYVRKVDEDIHRNFMRIASTCARKYPNLFVLNGRNIYGSDEVSMDGVHPNDDAFAHMSQILYKKISAILDKK